MEVDGLTLPGELVQLLDDKRWPRDAAEAERQHLQPIVPSGAVQNLAADETAIFLYPPPFGAVRAGSSGVAPFWNDPRSAPGEISFAKSIVIGDFGLGSDSPIILDYRVSLSTPRLLRLKWGAISEGNHWILLAKDFREFAEKLALHTVTPRPT
jgi:hypothetical protein